MPPPDQPPFDKNSAASSGLGRFVAWPKKTEPSDTAWLNRDYFNPIFSSISSYFSPANPVMDASTSSNAATGSRINYSTTPDGLNPSLPGGWPRGMDVGLQPGSDNLPATPLPSIPEQPRNLHPPPSASAVATYGTKPLPSVPRAWKSGEKVFRSQPSDAFRVPKESRDHATPAQLWSGDEDNITAILDVSPEEMKAQQAAAQTALQADETKSEGPQKSVYDDSAEWRSSVYTASVYSQDQDDYLAPEAPRDGADKLYAHLLSECSIALGSTQLGSDNLSQFSKKTKAASLVPASLKIFRTDNKFGSQRSKNSKNSSNSQAITLSDRDVYTGGNLSDAWLLPALGSDTESKIDEPAYTASVVTETTITPENATTTPAGVAEPEPEVAGEVTEEQLPKSCFEEDDSDEEPDRFPRLAGRHRSVLNKMLKRGSSSLQASASSSVPSIGPSPSPSTPSGPPSPLTPSTTTSPTFSFSAHLISDRLRKAAGRSKDWARHGGQERGSELDGRPSTSSSTDNGGSGGVLTPTSTSSSLNRRLGTLRHRLGTSEISRSGSVRNKMVSSLARRTGNLVRQASRLGGHRGDEKRREELKNSIRLVSTNEERDHDQYQSLQQQGAPARPERPAEASVSRKMSWL